MDLWLGGLLVERAEWISLADAVSGWAIVLAHSIELILGETELLLLSFALLELLRSRCLCSSILLFPDNPKLFLYH